MGRGISIGLIAALFATSCGGSGMQAGTGVPVTQGDEWNSYAGGGYKLSVPERFLADDSSGHAAMVNWDLPPATVDAIIRQSTSVQAVVNEKRLWINTAASTGKKVPEVIYFAVNKLPNNVSSKWIVDTWTALYSDPGWKMVISSQNHKLVKLPSGWAVQWRILGTWDKTHRLGFMEYDIAKGDKLYALGLYAPAQKLPGLTHEFGKIAASIKLKG
jgi:hypothetical protein